MTVELYQAAPDSLVVRELEVGGRVLVTTLLCPNITPKNALKELYKRRRQVELDIRNLKTTLGMTTLSCKTPEMGETKGGFTVSDPQTPGCSAHHFAG